jgi:diacylglycerol kinase (ATP)
MPKRSTSGLQRLCAAAGFSAKGLATAWRNEVAFRQEILLVALLLPASFWVGQTGTQRALLILSALLILIVELINSAIELVVDRIGPEFHPLSGQAKDMGSAAVLLSLILAALVWGVIAWQRWGPS